MLSLVVLASVSCPARGPVTFRLYVVNSTANTTIDQVLLANQATGNDDNVLNGEIGPGQMVLFTLSLATYGTNQGVVQIHIVEDDVLHDVNDVELGPDPVVALYEPAAPPNCDNIDFGIAEFDEQ